MTKEELTKLLDKYNLTHSFMKRILKHMTHYEDHVKVNKPTKIGDSLGLRIWIIYTFDDIEYNVDFIPDEWSRRWSWEYNSNNTDESDIHYIFNKYICDFLGNIY